MPVPTRGLLFDLDGVLINSLPSIHACMNHALKKLGYTQVSPAAIRPMIGPPLHRSAGQLLGTDDPAKIDRFIALYRERYDKTCVHESLPTPQMAEVLAVLNPRFTLAVATSKPRTYAVRILEHLAVAHHFCCICGPQLEARRETKAQVIAEAMAEVNLRTGTPNVHQGLWMIGDRAHDVEGAAHHNIPTIGVTSGMGGEHELRAAGARHLIHDLRELPPLLDQLARRSQA